MCVAYLITTHIDETDFHQLFYCFSTLQSHTFSPEHSYLPDSLSIYGNVNVNPNAAYCKKIHQSAKQIVNGNELKEHLDG